jgi:hypothetical protein
MLNDFNIRFGPFGKFCFNRLCYYGVRLSSSSTSGEITNFLNSKKIVEEEEANAPSSLNDEVSPKDSSVILDEAAEAAGAKSPGVSDSKDSGSHFSTRTDRRGKVLSPADSPKLVPKHNAPLPGGGRNGNHNDFESMLDESLVPPALHNMLSLVVQSRELQDIFKSRFEVLTTNQGLHNFPDEKLSHLKAREEVEMYKSLSSITKFSCMV